ncbi:MAG: hypothetical protein RL563_2444 [Pseudomonadota bacterium]|jgi:hypothetical protein
MNLLYSSFGGLLETGSTIASRCCIRDAMQQSSCERQQCRFNGPLFLVISIVLFLVVMAQLGCPVLTGCTTASTKGIDGAMIRDLRAECLLNRFGSVLRTPHTIQWLSDNGPCYAACETMVFGRSIGLDVCTTRPIVQRVMAWLKLW